MRLGPTVALALAVGLFGAGYLVNNAGGQGAMSRFPPGWPPAPDSIVNLRGEVGNIDDGDVVTAFTVPNNRWLVVTDVRFGGWGETDPTTGASSGANFTYFEFGEEIGGTFSPKLGENTAGIPQQSDFAMQPFYSLGAYAPFSTVTGLTFHPGSKVRFRYSNWHDVKGDAAHAHVNWNIVGYLTP